MAALSLLLPWTLGAALAAPAALWLDPAQDGIVQDDDFEWNENEEDQDEEEDDTKRLDEDDAEIDDEEDPDESLDEFRDPVDDGGEPEDFLDDDDPFSDVKEGGEGQDNAQIYRRQQQDLEELPPEEQLLAWEAYLQKYPDSLFKDRIQEQIDQLAEEGYRERYDEGYTFEDAKDREFEFTEGLQIEPIDPRTRVQAGIEFGLPNYFNLMADLEYQLRREWSAHVGLRHRYTGWNLELGSRYALVKSTRLELLATGMLDLRVNTNPAYLGLRPQVAVGKRVGLLDGLDLQAQAGVDLELRDPFAFRLIGGGNACLQLSDVVAAFAETNFSMRPGPTDKWFGFDVATVGFRFQPKKVDASISAGGTVPYYQNYWGYHFGAAQVEGSYYFDPAFRR